VWLPPGYDPDRAEPYPVFFLQHGGAQTWTDWIEVGFAAQILDNTYAACGLVPMVVVMSNGNGVNFPNELTQRIVPATEAAYNVSSVDSQRAVAGLSLGSGHALSTLFTFPGQFGYVGGFSAFSNVPASANVAAINAGTQLLRIYTGDIQDFTHQNTLTLINNLTNRGINHEFAPVIPGPHSWDVWQKALIDFLPRMFGGTDGVADPTTLPAICTATFGGFHSPVENAPVVNEVKAGRTIPVKFSLAGEGYLPLIDSQAVDCDTLEPTGEEPSPLSSPGGSRLELDGDEYQVNWKTDRAWEGTCRRLTVHIPSDDGVAYFDFR
jgi:S-formylglutathione hydrolase FrmB